MPSAIKSHSCCDENQTGAHQTEIILGLCARARPDPKAYCRLTAQADLFTSWERLLIRAEAHGMGPLVYAHLKQSEALIPAEARRSLQAIYLKHRHASQARGQVLAEILPRFEQQDIPALVLKGAALAYLVYPEPGLRPMRDIDLLVKSGDAGRAQETLIRMGFQELPYLKTQLQKDHHHLPMVTRMTDGLSVGVEIHTDIFPATRHYRSQCYEDLIADALPFSIQGIPARTLGVEDMLWHVYRHAIGPPLLASPLRFIHLADLVSLVECFVDRIDWERLERQHPRLFHILPYLDALTPWSEPAAHKLQVGASHRLKDAGVDYLGWPRKHLRGWRRRATWRILRRSLAPPEWWLYLYYGIGSPPGGFYHRYFRHPLHLAEWIGHFAKERWIGSNVSS